MQQRLRASHENWCANVSGGGRRGCGAHSLQHLPFRASIFACQQDPDQRPSHFINLPSGCLFTPLSPGHSNLFQQASSAAQSPVEKAPAQRESGGDQQHRRCSTHAGGSRWVGPTNLAMARLHLFTGVDRHLEPGQECTFGRANCCGKEVAAVSRRVRPAGDRRAAMKKSCLDEGGARQQAPCFLQPVDPAFQPCKPCPSHAATAESVMPSAVQRRQQFRLACLPGAGAQVEVQLTSLSAVNPTKVLLGSGSGAVLLEAGALCRVGCIQCSSRVRSGLQTLGVAEGSTAHACRRAWGPWVGYQAS